MNWMDCTDDGCQIHLGEKQGSGWYPQFTRRSRKPSVAHDRDWRQEMEANPGEDWAPQQPRRRRARRAHHEITSWEHCFNENCNEHRWEKVDAGYYPRQVGEKGTLSKNDRREHRKRRAVRTRLEGEGSAKTNVPDVENLEKSDLGPPKPTRRRCTDHRRKRQRPGTTRQGKGETPTSLQSMQTEDAPNRGTTVEGRSLASWDRCKRGKGANVTNGD